MSDSELSTLKNIHIAAKKEFMQKGFKSASLRNIVKTAGVTTGAFYGYYNSKEELFDAIVGEAADYVMSLYKKAQNDFAELPAEEQRESVSNYSDKYLEIILLYAYDHLDEFKLILTCSEGTRYENFIHNMVEIEIEATHKFNDVLNSMGGSSRLLNPQLEHILISGMMTAFFEIIIHEMPLDKAKEYLKELHTFYNAGWQKIMGY